jgi:hypothetical protein
MRKRAFSYNFELIQKVSEISIIKSTNTDAFLRQKIDFGRAYIVSGLAFVTRVSRFGATDKGANCYCRVDEQWLAGTRQEHRL